MATHGAASRRVGGQVAVVTGAARGIGARVAEALVREGAAVVLTDVLEEEGRAAADALGDGARFVRHDVTSPEDWQRVVAGAEDELGPVSLLVNNAGVFFPGGVADATEADVRRAFEVNQLSVFLGMNAVVDSMRRAGQGSIVNVSSSAGMVGVPGALAYSASKWAVRGMTKSAALDLGPDGIRVNSVHPGLTDTPIFAGFPAEQLAAMTAPLPISRMAQPAEVASLVLFLCSGESAYCTGAEFVVDGGYACH